MDDAAEELAPALEVEVALTCECADQTSCRLPASLGRYSVEVTLRRPPCLVLSHAQLLLLVTLHAVDEQQSHGCRHQRAVCEDASSRPRVPQYPRPLPYPTQIHSRVTDVTPRNDDKSTGIVLNADVGLTITRKLQKKRMSLARRPTGELLLHVDVVYALSANSPFRVEIQSPDSTVPVRASFTPPLLPSNAYPLRRSVYPLTFVPPQPPVKASLPTADDLPAAAAAPAANLPSPSSLARSSQQLTDEVGAFMDAAIATRNADREAAQACLAQLAVVRSLLESFLQSTSAVLLQLTPLELDPQQVDSQLIDGHASPLSPSPYLAGAMFMPSSFPFAHDAGQGLSPQDAATPMFDDPQQYYAAQKSNPTSSN